MHSVLCTKQDVFMPLFMVRRYIIERDLQETEYFALGTETVQEDDW